MQNDSKIQLCCRLKKKEGLWDFFISSLFKYLYVYIWLLSLAKQDICISWSYDWIHRVSALLYLEVSIQDSIEKGTLGSWSSNFHELKGLGELLEYQELLNTWFTCWPQGLFSCHWHEKVNNILRERLKSHTRLRRADANRPFVHLIPYPALSTVFYLAEMSDGVWR